MFLSALKIKRRLLYLLKTVLYFFVLFISLILKCISSGSKNIWIISERGDDARDNGYHLFNYIMSLNSRPKIFYIIDKASSDFRKIEHFQNIINTNSFKHWLYFALSEVKISTHIMGFSPDRNLFTYLDRKFGLVFGKKIFLQHGITKDNMTMLHYPNARLDLFICGAKPEYEYVRDNFNHNEKVVQYTGLARFDKLHSSETKNQILLMPSWRMYLDGKKDEDYVQSIYYKRYESLLNNKKLSDLLQDSNYELIFYPHPRFQKYLHLFDTDSQHIKMAASIEYDIQTLLKESALLITDYSSVYFDFAYMQKPAIYYQFDAETFFETHYKKGYFNYQKMGFGDVVSDEEQLIKSLEKSIYNRCMISDEYRHRINGFFELYDMNNCKRIYEAIINAL